MKIKAKRILVVVDNSLDPIHEAIRSVEDQRIHITVIKVLPTYEGELNLTGVRDIRSVIDGGKEEFINDIKKLSNKYGLDMTPRFEYGDFEKKIVQFATEDNCDLIMMRKMHGGALSKILLGDPVKKVRCNVHCPVIEVTNGN